MLFTLFTLPALLRILNKKEKRKMLKRFLCFVILMFAIVGVMTSCGHKHNWSEWQTTKEASCKEEGLKAKYCLDCDFETTETIPVKTGIHADFRDRMYDASHESSYNELYALYTEILNHENENGCKVEDDYYWSKSDLMTSMLYGEWKNANGDYINYTYVYEDYNNTKGDTWYGTNLPTSKIFGNTYYYYTEVNNNKLVIGYEDKITEERTDNFVITFNEDCISVESKVENKTYTLKLNSNYSKTRKDNAKTAYIYLAKNVFSFKVPSSVKVTQCYVDYEEKIVYATLQASNSFGGTVTTEYKLYTSGGKYYMDEYSHSYSSNIDLTELNEKLKNYVSTGG